MVLQNFTVFVDATLGSGGHAEAMLERANKDAILIGIDRDLDAVLFAKKRLESKFPNRVKLYQAKFSELPQVFEEAGVSSVDAFFFDLGASLYQIENPKRGFSYTTDGPLDMRMGLSKLSAYDIVNTYTESELEKIFLQYGEERHSRKIAKEIVKARTKHPITRTGELSYIIRNAVPEINKIKTLARIFQALRIAVNDELNELRQGLEIAINALREKGRIGVIAYHSLEDRITKDIFRKYSSTCICPPSLPVCTCNAKRVLKILTKHPLKPKDEEIASNRRARSARFRVAERIKEGSR